MYVKKKTSNGTIHVGDRTCTLTPKRAQSRD